MKNVAVIADNNYFSVPDTTEQESAMSFFNEAMTFEEVDQILHYEPETGKLLWKVKTAKKVVAGLEAGAVKGTRIDADGNKVSYRYISLKGKSVPAARVAWLLLHEEWPVARVFFKDKNPLNLRADNLYLSNSVITSHDLSTSEGRADYYRDYRKENAMDWKDSHLQTKFGIGLSDYASLVAKQNNKCAICGDEETEVRNGKTKALAVDHCHVTSKIRGLLCVSCNTGLGKFGDDPARLRAAADYIEKHAVPTESNVIPLKKET